MTNYDPACERIDTAIKAVWMLYRRGRWELLTSLGFIRDEHEPLFLAFDLEHITSDHGLIRHPSQIKSLLHFFGPSLVERALELIERYQLVTQPTRLRYYGKD